MDMAQKAALSFAKRAKLCVQADGCAFKDKNKLAGRPIANAGAEEAETKLVADQVERLASSEMRIHQLTGFADAKVKRIKDRSLLRALTSREEAGFNERNQQAICAEIQLFLEALGNGKFVLLRFAKAFPG